jgi:NTP pyrophosphatase (non-canonical NTP hydrolase)
MKSFIERLEIYKKAENKWGIDSQLDMVVEESAELIVAIKHYQRIIKSETIMDIAEEIADVELALEHLKNILSIDAIDIDNIKERKLNRLCNLLEK